MFGKLVSMSFALAMIMSVDANNETDKQALVAIREQISADPLKHLSSWNSPTVHFCNWEGVTCDDSRDDQRVIALDLSSMELAGSVSPFVGNLTSLQALILDDNFFTGQIPEETGRLFRLQRLSLANNSFRGEIPGALSRCPGLEFIDLEGNFLGGEIPPSLWNLSSLRVLNLSYNSILGSIPAEIGKLYNLEHLQLSANKLSGAVPSAWGSLKRLELLDLGNNSLGSVEGNDLAFFASLSNTVLKILHLNGNNLKDGLPHSVINLSTVQSLRLDENRIYGVIPQGIGLLVNLYRLALNRNNLSGTVPESIGNLTRLEGLYLSGNKLSGKIPASIGNINFLSILEMQENMLEGSLPVSLANYRSLENLNLSYNQLTGTIPEAIFHLRTLLGLSLQHNIFSGNLPSEIGPLKNLVTLDLSNNNISGELPHALGSSVTLEFLSVRGNSFQGRIPVTLTHLGSVQQLDLSRNSFSGGIPEDFADFDYIQMLNLSFNMLEGKVPDHGVFENTSRFSIEGNGELCGGTLLMSLPRCPGEISKGKHSAWGLINFLCGATGHILLLLSILLLARELSLYYHGRHSEEVLDDSLLGNQYPKVPYVKLEQATDNFSAANLIGKGRYSTVYKGILDLTSQPVAVKVLNLQVHGATRSFEAECEALKNIRHRNIVKIVTSYSGTDPRRNEFKALVYELSSNGSLETWLHPSPPFPCKKPLSLIQRLNIAIDVASALHYLHHSSEIRVIHRDIKPSNILLDHDFCARLGDFGSARSLLVPTVKSTHLRIPERTLGIIGTLGYIALEYGMGGPVSTLVDVYSYGILLLEMFTAKRPTNRVFRDNFSLHNYVEMALPDRVMDIVDPRLLAAEEEVNIGSGQSTRHAYAGQIECCLASILRVGVICSAQLPNDRMDIADALAEVHCIRDAFFSISS